MENEFERAVTLWINQEPCRKIEITLSMDKQAFLVSLYRPLDNATSGIWVRRGGKDVLKAFDLAVGEMRRLELKERAV